MIKVRKRTEEKQKKEKKSNETKRKGKRRNRKKKVRGKKRTRKEQRREQKKISERKKTKKLIIERTENCFFGFLTLFLIFLQLCVSLAAEKIDPKASTLIDVLFSLTATSAGPWHDRSERKKEKKEKGKRKNSNKMTFLFSWLQFITINHKTLNLQEKLSLLSIRKGTEEKKQKKKKK